MKSGETIKKGVKGDCKPSKAGEEEAGRRFRGGIEKSRSREKSVNMSWGTELWVRNNLSYDSIH